MTPPPLALYVHLPWCVRKCPYCDFNSHAIRDDFPESAYVDALLLDLDSETRALRRRPIRSVFIGGGTPSVFSAGAVERLMAGLAQRVSLDAGAEITLEANPGTFDAARFEAFRGAGINRLSIGIQSFDDNLLSAIGRIHSGADAHRALEGARAAGFENINVDLMFGLPGQDVGRARADVEAALGHGPDHVSHYQLTIEPNTPFHRSPPELPDGDEIWEMQRCCHSILRREGFRRYEVSAFARTGRRCRHNLNYWRFGDYLGIGAGAHSKLTHAGSGRIERAIRHRHPRAYLGAVAAQRPVRARTTVTPGDLPLEFAMNAIRLLDGFRESTFEARTRLPVERLLRPLAQTIERGLVVRRGGTVRATALGMRFLDDVLLHLTVPAPDGIAPAGDHANAILDERVGRMRTGHAVRLGAR